MPDDGSRSGGGYAGTPLARKLGIKPGHRVRLRHAPDGWAIPGLPDGVDVDTGVDVGGDVGAHDPGTRGADVVLAFYRQRAALAAEAAVLVGGLADTAMLWIAWPRKAAGHVSDLTEDALREFFLPLGVVDVKVAALGEDWSGLKFVRRRENRRKQDAK